MKLKEFFVQHKQIFQLSYGIILIILIPLLISLNTLSVVGKYNDSIELSLERRALALGRSLAVSFSESLDNTEMLQGKIDKLTYENSDFIDLQILIPENNSFKVVAGKDKTNVNKFFESSHYSYVWSLKEREVVVGKSAPIFDQDKESFERFSEKDRIWLVGSPIYNNNGEKEAILNFQLSSKIIDDAINNNKSSSIILLITTIIIVILFLSVSVRIWDYAILYRKIKEVDKMKDEFIAIASHELRTPLTAIRGYTSLMMEGTYGKVTVKMKEGFKGVMASIDRLSELVEDLLNVSRIEQGRLKVENQSVQIKPIIKEIILSLLPSAQEKKLVLNYKEGKEKLPKIIADPSKLKQVLVNLIGNSIKYTEKGSVIITTEVEDNKIKIKISDTGVGMSPEEQKHLFEKFYRAKNEKTEKIIGTGLGLWITKQITELMNGEIIVESMQGVGSRITVVLDIEK
ncbi:HAMP domain-containing histidine kinase [Candidatus Falkowbacteria bacterium]|jgi:signal transduction histidine kinase|nr:HAMP domain-containing histidine kinase [Candidatus Falkowbacteria bacterium]MBT4433194.1 HAMP domain-containing histidine kinase [Candidatus Falkowbacteria bacterium]